MLWLNNLKIRTVMNAKISVFVIYIVLKRSTYNLHDCTVKSQQKFSLAYLNHSHLKCILQKVSKITGVKLIVDW